MAGSQKISLLVIVLLRYDVTSAAANVCRNLDVCPLDDDVTFSPSTTPLRRHLEQNCFCDQFCHLMHDCCSEVNDVISSVNDVRENVNRWSHLEGIHKHLHCSPLESASGIKYVSDTFYKTYLRDIFMVSSCPNDYDNDVIARKCGNMSSSVEKFTDESDHIHEWPVTSNHTGVWYRNVFCAACWQEYDLQFWPAATHCSKTTSPPLDFLAYDTEAPPDGGMVPSNPFCNEDSFMFLSPTGFHNLRSCVEAQVVTTCSKSWTNEGIRAKCENAPGSLVYDHKSIPYRNIDCYKCNNLNTDDVRCSRNLTNYIELNYDDFMSGMFPITVLFDPKQPKSSNKVSGSRCPPDSIYDAFTKSCKKLFCPGSNILLDEGPCPHTTLDNCSQINVGQNDYILIRGNATLTDYDVTLTPDKFLISENGSLSTCVRFVLRLGSVGDEPLDTATLVSVITQLISIVCLILNLIVYSALPKLRNTPGKTLMSLVISLLLAQAVFLGGAGRTGHKEICFTIAVVIHYSTLAAFFWMNALAVDLALTFAPNMRQRSRNSQKRRFLYFSLYGWLGPLVVVVVSIILEVFREKTSPFNPNYASHHVCWLSNIHGLVVLFLVPIAFLLFINVILYIYTTTNIIRASKVGAKARESSTTNLAIYIKLSFIMGIAWVFAFLWMLTRNEVIRYIFIIANGLQGLFLFISFVCRKRVYDQLLVRIGKKTESESKKSNSYSNCNTNRITDDTKLDGTSKGTTL